MELLLHIEMVWAPLTQGASWVRGVLGMSHREETPGQTRDYLLWLAWEHLGVTPDKLEEVWDSLLRLLPREPALMLNGPNVSI